MPRQPLKPCKHPGCPNLTSGRYCEQHIPIHRNADRLTAHQRGYGSQWRKASKQFLKQHPLCVSCLKDGKLVSAEVVDHITPHRGDYTLFWNQNNWQGLCKPCHDRKTGQYDSRPTYK